MSLDNLFIQGPQFSETSMIKLPQNVEEWSDFIIGLTKEKFPTVDGLPMTLNLKELNEEAATAIGSIIITHPILKKTLYLPIIIKNGFLYPIDIYQDENQVVKPITPDTFDIYFFNEKSFDQLERRTTDPMGQYFSDPSMWQSTYPPLQGRYAYASAAGNMLGMALDTANIESAEEFEKTLTKNPEILVGFKRSGNLDIIKAAASKIVKIKDGGKKMSKMVSPEDPMSSMPSLTPVYVTIKKDPKKYTILSTHKGQFVTKTSFNSKQEAIQWLSNYAAHLTSHPEDLMNDVDHYGSVELKMPESGKTGVFLFDWSSEQKPIAIKEYGAYKVRRMADGVLENGLVIPHVIDLDQKPRREMMFLGGTTTAMQPQISGIPSGSKEDAKNIVNELSDNPIQVGQTGVFVYISGDSAVATVPMQIIRRDRGNVFRAATFDGKVFRIYKSSEHHPHSIERIVKFSGADGDEYQIPNKMYWHPIQTMKPVSGSEKEFLLKTASLKPTEQNPLKVCWTGISFEASGKNIEKFATGFDHKNMSEDEVVFLARVLGADKQTAEKLVKTARQYGVSVVNGLDEIKDKNILYKRASQVKKTAVDFAKKLRTNLIKEASVIGDRDTVDAILSLNFINHENIKRFVDFLPILIKAHLKLAELVLASRIGVDNIKHDAAVTCMNRMTDVIYSLKALDNTMSPLSQKAIKYSIVPNERGAV